MTGVYRLRKNGKLIEIYPTGPNGEPSQYDMEWLDVLNILGYNTCHKHARSQIYPFIEGDKIEIECLLRD